MSRQGRSNTNSRRPVLDLLGDIKNGLISPRSLDPETRRRCVECMTSEGMTTSEIAKLLDRNERTIRRDLEAIRAENAVVMDGSLAPVLAGEMVTEMRLVGARLHRLTRDQGVAAATRVDAARACMDIIDLTLHRLQKIGVVPTAGTAAPADTDRVEARGSDSREIERLLDIAKSDPVAGLEALKRASNPPPPGDQP